MSAINDMTVLTRIDRGRIIVVSVVEVVSSEGVPLENTEYNVSILDEELEAAEIDPSNEEAIDALAISRVRAERGLDPL